MTIAHTEPNSVGAFNQADEQAIRYLGLNPSNPADRAMVAVAKHYDLDPMLKHVVVIPKGGVYITRDGLLDVAHRSGQLDGIVVEQEPTLDRDNAEWVARVSVWRKDMSHPFTFPGRYPISGSNKAYAQEMALKAAESHALRRAFRVTGLPALDERRPEEPRTTGLAAAQAALAPEEEPVRDVVDVPLPEEEPEERLDPEAKFDARTRFGKHFHATIREAEQAGAITDRHEFMGECVGREITSANDLTVGEARSVLTWIPGYEVTQ